MRVVCVKKCFDICLLFSTLLDHQHPRTYPSMTMNGDDFAFLSLAEVNTDLMSGWGVCDHNKDKTGILTDMT